MKLLTDMVGPESTSAGPYPAPREDDDGQAYLHDAACAHALMQAMEEFKTITGQIDDGESIEMRAGMIMRGWGFDSGEVE
jgi:hypothetical protein